MWAFRLVKEEQRYNLDLLTHHRLAEGQIYGEFASEEAMAAMVENANFIEEQQALYEATLNFAQRPRT